MRVRRTATKANSAATKKAFRSTSKGTTRTANRIGFPMFSPATTSLASRTKVVCVDIIICFNRRARCQKIPWLTAHFAARTHPRSSDCLVCYRCLFRGISTGSPSLHPYANVEHQIGENLRVGGLNGQNMGWYRDFLVKLPLFHQLQIETKSMAFHQTTDVVPYRWIG